jgi:4-hydroxy-3-polyprenylbenzoate decarboxylase
MNSQGKLKLVVAVTGASGALYAKTLLDKIAALQDQLAETSLVMSDNAKLVWKHELGDNSYEQYPFRWYEKSDFMAPFASGSAGYGAMVICPCSMGTLGRIASGVSDDLVTRAADVILKERRKLILVTRETPLNLIHINNMKGITEAGGIICPATPSFYSKPTTFGQLASTVIDRVTDLLGLTQNTYRWGE